MLRTWHKISALYFPGLSALTLLGLGGLCLFVGSVLVLLTPSNTNAEEEVAAPTLMPAAERVIRVAGKERKSSVAEVVEEAGVGTHLIDMKSQAEKTVKGVLYIIGFFLFGVAIYKKFRGKAAPAAQASTIEILSRRALDNRNSLIVIQCEGERILLSSGGEGTNFLTKLNKASTFEETLQESCEEPETPVLNLQAARQA